MSHYARLKVTQDAPVEVIRAAYRVLAAKYHPDRQAAASDDHATEAANAEMAALNTAYQVLIHPDRRREYDALLAKKTALRKSRVGGKVSAQPVAEAEPVQARVDMEWLPPKAPEQEQLWFHSRRTILLGGSFGAVLLIGGAFWISNMVVQHQMEKALSEQYAASPVQGHPIEVPVAGHERSQAGAGAARAVASGAAAGQRAPSVTELSKLSNEELIQLSELDGAPGPGKRRSTLSHPLDGQPLNLRQDGQAMESEPSSAR